MNSLNYTINISAPIEKVWHAMLDRETYEVWTGAFTAGSTYVGNWDKGSKIQFVSKEDGGKSGIAGLIVENIPLEYVSIEVIGEIIDGHTDASSDESKKWVGAHENYRFTENDGVTTVGVELTSDGYDEEIQKMFDGMWPQGLNKLKGLAEQA